MTDTTQADALRELKKGVESGTDTMPMHTACYRRFGSGCHIDGASWIDSDSYSAARGALGGAWTLHNAVLPEWQWMITFNGRVRLFNGHDMVDGATTADNPARAWLLAIIRAKLADLEAGL